MTTIAFDGRDIAVDRGMTYGQMIIDCQKWRRMKDGTILITSGDFSTANLLMDKYDAGTLFDEWPERAQADSDSRASIIRVDQARGRIEVLHSAPAWMQHRGKMAWGSGSDMAFGALLAGADARRAVKITCKHHTFSGLGVDVFGVR